MKRNVVCAVLACLALTAYAEGNKDAAGKPAAQGASAAGGPVTILWWSHWANEPAKKHVIETIKNDYMAAHPDVKIDLVWWDKDPLQNAWTTSMTAGKGAPDIVTDPAERIVEQIKAGWLLDLGPDFPWKNFYPEVETIGNYFPGTSGGKYMYHISRTMQMLFYNKELFKELGVTVPADYTFTVDQLLDIVKKGRTKGYAGVANAIGNRPYPAVYLTEYLLLNKVGGEDYLKYRGGTKSWDTPEAREVLDWTTKFRDAGFWPDSFASMSIDEFHVYFHTQRKALMFMIPTWYTGRAFKAMDQGGQDPAFQFGMLRYPKLAGAKGNGQVLAGFESGYVISSQTKHPEIARDILAFASQPKYGALWAAVTNSPSAIKFTDKDWPKDADNKWAWYHNEMNRVYGDQQAVVLATPALTGAWNDAVKTVLNEGLPLKLLTVDQAVKKLDAAVGK